MSRLYIKRKIINLDFYDFIFLERLRKLEEETSKNITGKHISVIELLIALNLDVN